MTPILFSALLFSAAYVLLIIGARRSAAKELREEVYTFSGAIFIFAIGFVLWSM